jgi:hypothetical protein
MRLTLSTPKRCEAEEGIPGINVVKRCPRPAMPGKDYCARHLVMVRRLEARFRKRQEFWEKYVEVLNQGKIPPGEPG